MIIKGRRPDNLDMDDYDDDCSDDGAPSTIYSDKVGDSFGFFYFANQIGWDFLKKCFL